MVPRSHSGIDPQMHVHVLKWLVTTTDEVVENIPIFLELLDQPVKDPTLRPLNVEKWKELLHITVVHQAMCHTRPCAIGTCGYQEDLYCTYFVI